MNMTITAQRLREAMEENRCSQEALAHGIGVTQGAISQILSGRTQRSRYLPAIANHLGVSLPWLAGDTDDRHSAWSYEKTLPPGTPPSEEQLIQETTAAAMLGLSMIPEVDIEYSMGGGAVVADFASSTKVPFRRDWLQRLTRGGPSDVFLTRGRGDSMMPTILDGDDVLVNRAENRIRQAEDIWAVGYGDLGMIKRIRRRPGGTFELNSDNPSVRPIEATEDELFIVGRVIWIGRRM